MPQIDLPLKELKKYNGSSPCPKDLDSYWDESLQELDNLDPQVEFIKRDYPAVNSEVYDLYYTGTGGARIHALHLRPKNVQGHVPAVVEFHGYTWMAGNVASKLKYVSMGMSVFSMDCRGQGGDSEDRSVVKGYTHMGHIIRGIEDKQDLLYRHIFRDGALLCRIAAGQDFVDDKRVMTTGGSQGGALALAVAALYPQASHTAAAHPFLSDYRRVWDMNTSGAYAEIREWFRRFDPAHKREDEIFERLGYIDIQNLSKRIKAKTLVMAGLEDEVCPPSTVFAAYNKIKAEKRMIIYPDWKHEAPPEWEDEVLLHLTGS